MGTAMQGPTVASVCSALKVWAQLLQGVQLAFHMFSIAAIAVRPCLGVSLFCTFSYGVHSQVALERGVCGWPSWGKEEDFFPGLGEEMRRGGTNLQLHCGTKVLGSFSGGHSGLWFHPMAQGPTAAGTQPMVLLAKG